MCAACSVCSGKGCDEGCDGGPTADQQWEDSAELGSSEHTAISSGIYFSLFMVKKMLYAEFPYLEYLLFSNEVLNDSLRRNKS